MHTTPTFLTSTDTLSPELSSLRDHIGDCRSLRGPLFRALCIADAFRKFLDTRVITTLLVMSLVVAVVVRM